MEFFLDGCRSNNSNAYSNDNFSFTQFGIGNNPSATYNGNSFTGSINEVITYAGALTTFQRQQVESYIVRKWGITQILPNYPSYNFSIKEFNGVALWLDASDSSTIILSGSNVTTWKDKSGNGNDATASSIPTLSTINSIQAMNMTNGPYFTGPVSITTSTMTCFAVANTTRALPNTIRDQRLVSLVSAGNDGDKIDSAIGLYNSSSANTSAIGTYRNSLYGPAVAISSNSPFIAVSQYDGTNVSLWRNGTAGNPVTSTGSFAITKYGIGNQATPTTEYWEGTIGEVIVLNIALTDAQRQQIEGYLAWKWGINGSLPTNHPYYSAKP
jgi:hypothetical protein